MTNTRKRRMRSGLFSHHGSVGRSPWRCGVGGAAGGAGGRRGSALFFVAVSLVLMAILGTTYIQLARMDRVATRRYVKGDIQSVVESVIQQIRTELYKDIFDEDGKFFNGHEDAPGGPDEYYDYPWTNKHAFHEVRLKNGDLALASGGKNDDRWLASTMPDFDTDSDRPRWRHITNLNGIFLRIPKPGGRLLPQENLVWLQGDSEYIAEGPEYTFHDSLMPRYAVTDTSTTADDGKDLIITNRSDELGDSTTMEVGDASWEARGVDADGDGIVDSRWAWAPIRRIGDVNYVMAVRIIDNSALLNANVALGLVSEDGTTTAPVEHAPRWWYPSELDLGRFVYKMGDDTPTYMGELSNLLRYRLNFSGASLPTPWGEEGEVGMRRDYWENGPRLYENFTSAPVTSRWISRASSTCGTATGWTTPIWFRRSRVMSMGCPR